MNKHSWHLSDLIGKGEHRLPSGGRFETWVIHGQHPLPMTVLLIHNGRLTFTVLPDRGMDVGEIRLGEEKMSWDRGEEYLLHPDQVNLQEGNGTGWLKGFYGAVSSIGPELFGTPGEGYTLHGTGSYSPADLDSILIGYDENEIWVEGTVTVRGYADEALFEKRIRMVTRWGSALLLREETTRNISAADQTLDDGYHIQLSGPFMHGGGRYVLPVASCELLLRDSSTPEEDPLGISARSRGETPIRCYQYVPKSVKGLDAIPDIDAYLPAFTDELGVTAEMMVNEDQSAAGFVIRPLSSFPRSLIAKEISDGFMFALEPCRTRPNRMSQKHTDGEAFVLGPGSSDTTYCLIGVTRDQSTIDALHKAITNAAENH